jgi:hypothetical protein
MFKLVVVAISLSWCASAFGAEEPQWLKEARAREGKPIDAREIVSKDGAFKARLPAKLVEAIVIDQGSYSVELDADAGSSIYCEVYPEGIDLANTLRGSFENSMRAANESQGKVEARALEVSDAGAIGTIPFISTGWLYRAKAEDNTARVGALKQFVMEKNDFGVYCAHNDLGFTQTFARVTRAFAQTLETKTVVTAPYYVEISTATVSERKAGVAIVSLERDSEGDLKARQTLSMLIPSGESAISQDTTDIAWLEPDGELINALHVDVSNGEMDSRLALKWEQDEWVVDGEVQGKAVKTKLPKGSEPGSWVTQAHQVKALLAEPNPVGKEHSIGMWISANPDKLTTATTKILAKQGEQHFTALGDIGGMRANLKIEKSSGMASAADLKAGPISIKIDRVYVNGSF